ncbi:MAG: hypothetical protein LRY30_01435, partial [Gammaproteobacteria bacterium]|nr:hypothetical protein [Gammaproteobacteria bacterium]
MKKRIAFIIAVFYCLILSDQAFSDVLDSQKKSISSDVKIHKTDDNVADSLRVLLLDKINTDERNNALHVLDQQAQDVYIDVIEKTSSQLIIDGHGDFAIALINMGLIKYPESIDLRRCLATVQFQSGKIDQAKKTLTSAHPDIEKNQKYYQLLAIVDIELKLFSDAELLYTRLIQLDPNNPELYLGLAISYHGQEKNSLAAYYYQQSLKNAKKPWVSE